jgi:hypothetical protein
MFRDAALSLKVKCCIVTSVPVPSHLDIAAKNTKEMCVIEFQKFYHKILCGMFLLAGKPHVKRPTGRCILEENTKMDLRETGWTQNRHNSSPARPSPEKSNFLCLLRVFVHTTSSSSSAECNTSPDLRRRALHITMLIEMAKGNKHE